YDTKKEENVPAKVIYVSITETDILVHVYTSEGEDIKTTMLHPFYVKNVKSGEDETYGIWKASANLVAGDELLTDDGRIVYVEEVRIERLAENIKVYNLEIEGFILTVWVMECWCIISMVRKIQMMVMGMVKRHQRQIFMVRLLVILFRQIKYNLRIICL
ncbi:MAG: hypothetical protein IJA10_08020, partial [Lachnospiraceae bacterium]|nr:hypothetical protein [Lachnospiraceae bacterium]